MLWWKVMTGVRTNHHVALPLVHDVMSATTDLTAPPKAAAAAGELTCTARYMLLQQQVCNLQLNGTWPHTLTDLLVKLER